MRLSVSKSKNATSFYVIKSIYVDGKRSSKVVEKLGTEAQLRERYPDQDPFEWARAYVEALNREEEAGKMEVIARFSNAKRIPSGVTVSRKGGYLFLQALYHALGYDKICQKIQQKYAIQYDLNDILKKLLFTRMLEPGSKRSSFDTSQQDLERPTFDLHHIYRALSVLSKESDFIQQEMYRRSTKVVKRETRVLYYDCTNFFFELETEEGLKQYGQSKEHRPNPIVQMGLFLDGSGLPLAFSIHPGNTNEQTTLRPLERQILQDFSLSKFIVCTDAGLSSMENRKFNTLGERAYIVTQSLKKLKGHLKDWVQEPSGWQREGSQKLFDLRHLEPDDEAIYYKNRWIHENGLEQHLIVTYSPIYRRYQEALRERQVLRAEGLLRAPSRIQRKGAHDPRRFVTTIATTHDGEIASTQKAFLDEGAIRSESMWDGYYAVCTNLEGDPLEVIAVNKQRWEIEAAFRVMKTEFRARPVFLSRDDRIKAHFMTCFMAFMLYKTLEKKIRPLLSDLDPSAATLIETLRGMSFYEIPGEGYVPLYTRTPITDALHEYFGFHTDTEIVPVKTMKQIIAKTKKPR